MIVIGSKTGGVLGASFLGLVGDNCLKSPYIFGKLFNVIAIKTSFGILFVTFGVNWDKNPFNLLYKNAVLYSDKF